MAQNAITFDKVFKECYLPAFQNQVGIEPSAFFAKIKHTPLNGETVKTIATMGLNGGFGYGYEGKNTPASGEQQFQEFKLSAVDMYCNIEISDKVMQLSSGGKALVDALDVEVKSSKDACAWNIGRSLFGNGSGVLAEVQALSVAGNTVSIASTSDTRFLKEGLIIDFYATGAAVGSIPAVSGRRIVSVDRSSATKTITFSGTATTLSAGFITVQNSYGRELSGLGAIMDDNITSIYGITKADVPIVKPVVKPCGADGISNSVILSALRESTDNKNGKVNMLLCGNGAFDAYSEYLIENNVRVESNLELMGGFRGIGVQFSDRMIEVVNEKFVPNDEIWGVDTESFDFQHTDWHFLEKDGAVFNPVTNTSILRALLCNYGNLICSNPGGNIRITGAAA